MSHPTKYIEIKDLCIKREKATMKTVSGYNLFGIKLVYPIMRMMHEIKNIESMRSKLF
jgi:hypothetical protein